MRVSGAAGGEVLGPATSGGHDEPELDDLGSPSFSYEIGIRPAFVLVIVAALTLATMTTM